jgi:hypothetical protein
MVPRNFFRRGAPQTPGGELMRKTTPMSEKLLPQQQEASVFAEDLRGISLGLRRLRDSLPEPSTGMLEGEEPNSVAAELAGTVECVIHDDIEPAISKLRKAATVPQEELRREWRERRLLVDLSTSDGKIA